MQNFYSEQNLLQKRCGLHAPFSLPPGGRGTAEVVEGARAIILYCKYYPKDEYEKIYLSDSALLLFYQKYTLPLVQYQQQRSIYLAIFNILFTPTKTDTETTIPIESKIISFISNALPKIG